MVLAPLSHTGDANPIDAIWGPKRPPFPQGAVRIHPLQYSGETVQAKLDKVRLVVGSFVSVLSSVLDVQR